jgi:hypothetical protein
MLLSDELLTIISPESTSYIDFSDKEAKSFFEENFQLEWDNAIGKIITEYYDFDAEEYDEFVEINPNPMTAFEMENGFRAVFHDPYIIDQWASRAYPYESNTAIENAVNLVKEKYPDIKCSGCIQYAWSDIHCGACEQWEIGEEKIHEFVAHTIELVAKDNYFWEEINESENKDEIKKELLLYKEFLSDETIFKIECLL